MSVPPVRWQRVALPPLAPEERGFGMSHEQDPNQPQFSLAEVASFLGITERTMYRHRRSGLLTGGTTNPVRYSQADVERFRQVLDGEWIQPPLPGMEFVGIPFDQVTLSPDQRDEAASVLEQVASRR